jgi:hypothetical protein
MKVRQPRYPKGVGEGIEVDERLGVMWSSDNSVDEGMRTRPNAGNPRGKKHISTMFIAIHR